MMTDNKKPTGDNEVGYGKPPKEHQFKPGQSGNSHVAKAEQHEIERR